MKSYYQNGGQQLMQLFQAFADAVPEDEFSGAEEVAMMFQELSPEEQQVFIQQAQSIISQSMQYGGTVNNTGYLAGSATSKNPYNIIPSGNITMKGVDPRIDYIVGTDNLGNQQIMHHGNDYQFDGDFVIEKPIYAQTGQSLDNLRYTYSKRYHVNIKNVPTNPIEFYNLVKNNPLTHRDNALIESISRVINTKQQPTLSKSKNYDDSNEGYLRNALGVGQLIASDIYDRAKLIGKEILDDDYSQQEIDFSNIKLPSFNLNTKDEDATPYKVDSKGNVFIDTSAKPVKKIDKTPIVQKKKLLTINSPTNENLQYILAPNDNGNYIDQFDNIWEKDKDKNTYHVVKTDKEITGDKRILRPGLKGGISNNSESQVWVKRWLDSGLINPKGKNFSSVQKAVADFVEEHGDSDQLRLSNLRDGKFGKVTASYVPDSFLQNYYPEHLETIPNVLPENTFNKVNINRQKELLNLPIFDNGTYNLADEIGTEVKMQPRDLRSMIGVGKQYFAQTGYVPKSFKPFQFKNRINLNSDIPMGAESNMDFLPEVNVTNTPFLHPLEDIPMGAVSSNYTAPNIASRDMWTGRSADTLLDLTEYTDRFNNFLPETETNKQLNFKQNSDTFSSLIEKLKRKPTLSFDSDSRQIAPFYNLLKASEPIANGYLPDVNLEYAETPLLNPEATLQQLYNSANTVLQNVNTNSTTGQAFAANVLGKTQENIQQVMNDITQKNAQIEAQNNQARVNARNQQLQINIANKQQYLQQQLQAQANKDYMMGDALGDIDSLQAQKVKDKNQLSALLAMTPALQTLRSLLTGSTDLEINPNFQQINVLNSLVKTMSQIKNQEALQRELQRKQLREEKRSDAQVGKKLNSFFNK